MVSLTCPHIIGVMYRVYVKVHLTKLCFIAALNKGNIDVGVNSAQKMKRE